MSREDVDSLVQDLPDEKAKGLREKLEPHVGRPASNELPEDSGAIVGAYMEEEEAERWIAEYAEATAGESLEAGWDSPSVLYWLLTRNKDVGA